MGNCLVTTLKSSVNNEELLKIGEIKIKVGKAYAGAAYSLFTINFHNPLEKIHIEAIEGSFKDTVGGADITSLDALPLVGLTYKTIYIYGDVILSLTNKYNISGFAGGFYVYKVYGYGDIVNAANTIPHFNAFENLYCDKFGNVNESKSDIIRLSAKLFLDENPQNIADIAVKFPHIESLNAEGLSGNISALNNVSTLKTFYARGAALRGDVALLNVENFFDFTIDSAYLNFSWSNRASTKNIILGDIFLATTADRKRMIVDNSNCVRSDQSTMGVLRTLSIDTTDPDIAAALTRLRSKNVEVRRENNTVLN